MLVGLTYLVPKPVWALKLPCILISVLMPYISVNCMNIYMYIYVSSSQCVIHVWLLPVCVYQLLMFTHRCDVFTQYSCSVTHTVHYQVLILYIWQCLSPLCVWQQSAFTDIIITMLLMLYCNICTTAAISVTWAENMTLDRCNLQLASLLLLWLCLSVSVGKFKCMYACMTSIAIENIQHFMP